MHILVIDGHHVEAEFREKFGPAHRYSFFGSGHGYGDSLEDFVQSGKQLLSTADVVFDFRDGSSEVLPWPAAIKGIPVFLEATLETVGYAGFTNAIVYGFCGLPTLIKRPLLEISIANEADRDKLAETCAALGTDYRVVADRVGLVTPRVICQIINEACFTLQEGTASMQDIDLGMKLGTNYPHGPFAWANAIGVPRVYAVLEALWHDTHDERYKVCPLLKRQALRGEPFVI
ncbi:3-hydroxyacyl-CoA dehydrogenase family protein [Hymenobacter sp. IS2118]|uniref:3-hydroxyacyl-CoA dehydrogenase family protein n=1 Tax=Hymenobacter sp. IS2118 TaxID=1505605 RepID=UPI00054EE942|nr:3-hydroxyacyl-CoA dehydrogenase family protein [Hymenobacter sp. IS2118]